MVAMVKTLPTLPTISMKPMKHETVTLPTYDVTPLIMTSLSSKDELSLVGEVVDKLKAKINCSQVN